MKLERVFQIVAVILAGIAAYFLWTDNRDGAFVSAVLGSVAFFLSIRFQVKERNQARESRVNPDQSDASESNDPDEHAA